MSHPPTPTGAVLHGWDQPDGLECAIERLGPYARILIRGVLDAAAVPTVRTVVGDCLAGQPATVVLDVHDLRVGDPRALAVFGTVAQDAADWPGVPLALCRPNEGVLAALHQSPTCRYLPVYPTLEAAMAGMEDDDTDTEPGQMNTRLRPAAGAARQARELVTEACARWDLPQLVGPACTVVTELVNNAVVHARTPMEVMLRLRERRLDISVRDGSTVAPTSRGPASPTAPGGRGLMMVEAVAQRWGYTPLDGGKVVWAVLATDDPPAL